MSQSVKTVFITGATGLVGSYVALRFLKEIQKYKVICLKRRDSDLSLFHQEGIELNWVDGDLFDIDVLEEYIGQSDIVIHAAATVSFLQKERSEMYEVNVQGTQNMVNLCLDANIEHFIFVSSVSTFGRAKEIQLPISEKTKWQESPYNTHYAKSKHFAELEVWRAISEGLSATIVNPSIVLGGGLWRNSSIKLVDDIYNGLSFYPTGKSAFTDVRDVAEAIFLVVDRKIVNDQFIVAGENTSYQNLIESFKEAFDLKAHLRPVTPLIAKLALFREFIKSRFLNYRPLISKESLMISKLDLAYDNSKISKKLDFEFRKLDETIKDTSEAYLQSKSLGLKGKLLDF